MHVLDFSTKKIYVPLSRGTESQFKKTINSYGEDEVKGACAITVEEDVNHVNIIITGGNNEKGTILDKTLQFEISYEPGKVIYRNGDSQYLDKMKDKRPSHGCTKVILNNEKSIFSTNFLLVLKD